MIVQIRDRAALTSISLASLRTYLASTGWLDLGQWGERAATVFGREHDERSWEIVVPHNDTVAGYAEGMADAVAVLSAVEDRSQLDVLLGLAATSADLIRFHSLNGAAKEPLSLGESAGLLNIAYDLMAAAARSVERARAAYRGPLSSEIADYLDCLKPNPGYHEGFELTLRSPVPSGLGTQTDMGDDFQPPFSRQASLKLAEALKHSSDAVAMPNVDDQLASFRQAVPHGVSANLCDAVAKLAKQGEGVEISLSWAGVRPKSKNQVSSPKFRFSQHSADILADAAKSFRRDEPLLDESIIAQVVKLERDPKKQVDQRATILPFRERRPVKILVKFEDEDFATAIKAFDQREPISVDGDIYRVGNTLELRNPRNLQLVTET